MESTGGSSGGRGKQIIKKGERNAGGRRGCWRKTLKDNVVGFQ